MSAVRHFIYRAYDADDRLLYVGRTIYPAVRLKQHATKSHWFPDLAYTDFEERADWWDMVAAERRAIETEGPLHNIRHNGWKDAA